MKVMFIGAFGVVLTCSISAFMFMAKVQTGSGVVESIQVFGFLLIAIPLFLSIFIKGRNSFKSVFFSEKNIYVTDRSGNKLNFRKNDICDTKTKLFCSHFKFISFKYEGKKYPYILNSKQKNIF